MHGTNMNYCKEAALRMRFLYHICSQVHRQAPERKAKYWFQKDPCQKKKKEQEAVHTKVLYWDMKTGPIRVFGLKPNAKVVISNLRNLRKKE